MSRLIERIYIHCSYSEWGSFGDIDMWHKDRGFGPVYSPHHKRDIACGYHYVIHNQFTQFPQFKAHAEGVADGVKLSDTLYSTNTDGEIIPARPLEAIGSHVKGDNSNSVGIVYVGIKPTTLQMQAILSLCLNLCEEHNLESNAVLGHYEWYVNAGKPVKKTCPNFCMETFRRYISLFM